MTKSTRLMPRRLDQVVLDGSTVKFILQKKEVTMTDNEKQAWSEMILRRRRPQRLHADNGQAFSEPSAAGDAEYRFQIDHHVLNVFIERSKKSERRSRALLTRCQISNRMGHPQVCGWPILLRCIVELVG